MEKNMKGALASVILMGIAYMVYLLEFPPASAVALAPTGRMTAARTSTSFLISAS